MTCPRCGHTRCARTLTAYATVREKVAATPGGVLVSRDLLQVLLPVGPARIECMACGEAWWEKEAAFLAPGGTGTASGAR